MIQRLLAADKLIQMSTTNYAIFYHYYSNEMCSRALQLRFRSKSRLQVRSARKIHGLWRLGN